MTTPPHSPGPTSGEEEAGTHCVTCADELIRAVVQRVDGSLATVAVGEGDSRVIALDLVDGVQVGDVLLVHGGVALQRAEEHPGPTAHRHE
ncbi:MAG: hypothetical protein NVSMB29_12800 [Candidatus Dormibacteria bacterium]